MPKKTGSPQKEELGSRQGSLSKKARLGDKQSSPQKAGFRGEEGGKQGSSSKKAGVGGKQG